MVVDGGPLVWLDTLLGARNELLEAERDDAVRRAREAEAVRQVAVDTMASERQAAADALLVAEDEAARLRSELEQARELRSTLEAVISALEQELATNRQQWELGRDLWRKRVAEASANRTWDLVRRLEEQVRTDALQLARCHREHGSG